MEKETIKFNDFQKIDIRVGTITKLEIFHKTNHPAFKIWADFGDLGIKKTSAQITKNYSLDNLKGKQILGVINLPIKQISDMNSDFLLLGALNNSKENVVIIQPETKVENGSIIS